MKLSGMAGTGSGKLGSQVYASVAGEQVVRNYQPKVSNPNTSLQVNQRARFKLLSQLSQVYAPVMTFRKKGMTSARNLFAKANFDLSSGNDGQAQLSYENIQLTPGTQGLPGIRVSRQASVYLNIDLVSDASKAVDRVVYTLYKKNTNDKLQLISSIVVTEAGEAGTFHTYVFAGQGDIIVYAYGMKDMNSKASAKYGNYNVQTGEDIAKLLMNRSLSYNDYRFTKTRGVTIFDGQESAESAGPNQSRVFVTASGPGSVTGSGLYTNGAEVVITAVPETGCEFIGWQENGGNGFVAYARTIKFLANGLVDLIAVFQDPESSTGGLDGQEFMNPLPLADAEITIDGDRRGVASGNVQLDGSWDNCTIAGLGTNETLTFVPEGSYLGADDNIAFSDDGQPDGQYVIETSGNGSGAVYYGANVFFYIQCQNVTLPSDFNVYADGTPVTVSNNTITLDTAPDVLAIEGLDPHISVIFVPEGSYLGADDNDIFEYVDGDYQNANTGSINNGDLYYEGKNWLEIVIGGGPTQSFSVSVAANPSAGGSVSGAGSYNAGTNVTVNAVANSGYRFNGWYENDALVSSQSSYTFAIAANRNLEARFEASAQTGFSNVTVNGSPWNQNLMNQSGSIAVAGEIDDSFNGKKAGLVIGSVPTVGQVSTIDSNGQATISSGAFSFTKELSMLGRNIYLVAGSADSNNVTVETIYQYIIQEVSDE